jgi:hypothetical protein
MGVQEDFSRRQRRNKRKATPYRGFGNESDLMDALHTQKYVLMTGQNPKMTPSKGPFEGPASEEPMSPDNEEALRSLMRDLDEMGLRYTVQTGQWKDSPELSLIIWAASDADEDEFFMDMQELAEEYGQQAIMTVEPDAKTVIYPTEEGERMENPDPSPRPETYDEMNVREDIDEEGFTNITPYGPALEDATGDPESDVRLDDKQVEDVIYWQFEPKDWEELSPEQQAQVQHRMTTKEQARDPQRKQRRSDH